MHTHALFLGDEFLGEVTPDALNHYGPERLVALPSNYYAKGYRWTWSGRTPVEDPAAVQALLLPAVKAEGERRKMAILTSGGAKKTEYADKRAEVVEWQKLGGTLAAILAAFNAMPKEQRAVSFAYAIADAAAFGDTPADAIVRFKAGIAGSSSIATLSAIEAKGCAAIKAATTAAAKRAAAAAIAWPAS